MSRSASDELVGIILGILGGVALAEFLKNLLQKRCMYCNGMNEPDRMFCKFCGRPLK